MTLQQLNLDWLLEQMKKIMQLLPFNGVAGDVLQRTVDGAAWQPIGAVSMDIHGLTSTTPATNDELPIYDNDLVGNYKVTVQDILDMVPAAPVTSVNGQTGTVTLTASDVGALADTTPIPTDVSDLNNDLGFVDAAGAAAAAPVQSVNGQTGAVTVAEANDFDFTYVSPLYWRVADGTSIHDVNFNCFLAFSSDGNYLSFSGEIDFLTGNSEQWQYIYLFKNSNDEQLDFTRPSSNIQRRGIGIIFDENRVPIANFPYVHINIFTNGNINIAYRQLSTTPANTRRYLFIPEITIHIAE